MRLSIRIQGILILILCAASFVVWGAAFAADHRGSLSITYFHNAIYIEAPSGRQILIDGGGDASIIRSLSSVRQWWDHSIDIVVSTTPAQDFSTGLVDILNRFSVDSILQSGIASSDPAGRSLSDAITRAQSRGSTVVTVHRGEIVDLGEGARIEILSPDRNASALGTDGCVSARLVYGATAFLFPCGSSDLQKYLTYLDGEALHADVVRIGSESSVAFLGYASPIYVVYSRDCKKGVQTIETKPSAESFDMCSRDHVTFISNGQSVTRK
jgi:competence protein ComEC